MPLDDKRLIIFHYAAEGFVPATIEPQPTEDLSAYGFGQAWGHTRSWTNGPGYGATAWNGSGWVNHQGLYLQQYSGGLEHLILTLNGDTALYFDRSGNASWLATGGSRRASTAV